MLWLLLACVHSVPPSAAPAQTTSPTDPGMAPFTAHYEGAKMGLGLDCVVDEAPPHGAWTAILRVADPGTTAFRSGKLLCVIVHSPSMYRRAAVDDAGMMKCTAVVGVLPPRFSCEADRPPAAGMPVFDQASWDALGGKDEPFDGAGARPSGLSLAEASAQLDRDLVAMKRCDPSRQDVILPAELVNRLALEVVKGTDRNGDVETQEMVESVDAKLRQALAACPAP